MWAIMSIMLMMLVMRIIIIIIIIIRNYSFQERKTILDYKQFISMNTPKISLRPGCLFQIALNQNKQSCVANEAQEYIENNSKKV